MNKHSALSSSGSLLERAAEMYDFRAELGRPVPAAPAPRLAQPAQPQPQPRAPEQPAPQPRAAPIPAGPRQALDRESLGEAGYIVPEAAAGPLVEEFRIIKRQLRLAAAGKTGIAEDKRRSFLVCSARPDEGKTFCAVNLALSLAAEKDVEVLLVDGDFAKPEILSILGLEGGAGLTDALADPDADPEAFIIHTDLPGLSVLPAGRHANNVTELLGSARTREVMARLYAANPRRLILFDSPPALVASPASFLAAYVGQVLMVVRADQTVEADLREAVELLSGCEHVSLMLNGASFSAGGSRFGSYYGYGQ
jgi:protein-tyrosine kinase